MEKKEFLLEKKSEKINPLGKSITIGCISFIFILCLILGVTSHLNYKRSLYQRYESFITDILNYVNHHIDDADLCQCIETLERSEKYNQLEAFMDGIKEDFSIHYLYIIKPLNKNETGNVMSVISAENYYDRYIDTEGNLYLGWISDTEYDSKTAEKLLSIMEQKTPVFFEESTSWSVDYTGAVTLFNSKNKPYAILAVDVDITEIKNLIRKKTIETTLIIVTIGTLFTLLFLLWSNRNITKPIKLLANRAEEFAKRSHGQRNLDLLKFDAPELHTKNEIYSLAKAISQMTEDMRNYVTSIIQAELKAEEMKKKAIEMSELANKDALTGVRNKNAYDKEIKLMQYNLETGYQNPFGIAMIDLNFLKHINDNYGHDRGNISIKKLCALVCSIFAHSPVFRIGGDEFTVILQGEDYKNLEPLTSRFNQLIDEYSNNKNLEPWERISAAIGIATYNKHIDSEIINVFKRADQKMYERKKQMKAVRKD